MMDLLWVPPLVYVLARDNQVAKGRRLALFLTLLPCLGLGMCEQVRLGQTPKRAHGVWHA